MHFEDTGLRGYDNRRDEAIVLRLIADVSVSADQDRVNEVLGPDTQGDGFGCKGPHLPYGHFIIVGYSPPRAVQW